MKRFNDLTRYEKEFYKSNEPKKYRDIIFIPTGKPTLTMSIISLYGPPKLLGERTNLWNKENKK